jgi:hypothetical protein
MTPTDTAAIRVPAETSPLDKHCPGCGQTKPLGAFFRNRARKDGVSTYCKACRPLNVSVGPQALLSTEPLVPLLAAATGLRGNRGAREGEAGVRRLAQRMEAMFGGDAENYRVQIDRILHRSLTHLHFSSADRLCLAVGRHPAEIWRGQW